MSSMLRTFAALGVWGLVVFSGRPWALAQAQPGNAEVKPPRPPNPVLQVQNLPPELDAILLAWSQESAKVQKLQGEHHRFVYDTVFNTEKRAEGVFYYEAPGKGRIDLRPKPIRKDEVSKRTDKMGTPFKLEADRAERWICNGEDIWQVNDETKQVDAFPIPQANQGQNIMDGPMPFLFGMPPAKAKMRYWLKLLQENEQQAVIEVLPKLQLDAANWKKATVILDKAMYLPRAVQLINPAGTTETVYTFGQFQVNKDNGGWIQMVFGGDVDPFRPKLPGYAIKVHKPPQPEGQQPANTLPSVAGLTWKEAKELLEQLDCQVQFVKGQKATQGQLNYRVYQQDPAPKTPLAKGLQVKLTIYDVGPVPNIVGLHWKAAGKALEEGGYKVKYLPGQATTDEKQLYLVYQQSPVAGQQADYGSEITLTVYNKPQTAAN
jgi:TIGR03009 family protein